MVKSKHYESPVILRSTHERSKRRWRGSGVLPRKRQQREARGQPRLRATGEVRVELARVSGIAPREPVERNLSQIMERAVQGPIMRA